MPMKFPMLVLCGFWMHNWKETETETGVVVGVVLAKISFRCDVVLVFTKADSKICKCAS